MEGRYPKQGEEGREDHANEKHDNVNKISSLPSSSSSSYEELLHKAEEYCTNAFNELYANPPATRNEREEALWKIRKDTAASLCAIYNITTAANKEKQAFTLKDVKSSVAKAESMVMRKFIFERGTRVDGRKTCQVRPLSVELDVLPNTHGSSLFTRGDTQVLCAATIGHPILQRTTQRFLSPTRVKKLLVEYEFPPYSVNETGRTTQGRREIGHGELTEKALRHTISYYDDEDDRRYNNCEKARGGGGSSKLVGGSSSSPEAVDHTSTNDDKHMSQEEEEEEEDEKLPTKNKIFREETFKINAITTSSNGSSSMASVCSGSLALMHAGVLLNGGPVAGISMGLISLPVGQIAADSFYYEGGNHHQHQEGGTEEQQLGYIVLTDLMGLEDFLGDMDFKIAGTRYGVTAIQLDTKIPVPVQVLFEALDKANIARNKVLDVMTKALPQPRQNANVPELERTNVAQSHTTVLRRLPPEAVLEIESLTHTHIRIYNEHIEIFGYNEGRARAKDLLRRFGGTLKEGQTYLVQVVDIKDYGVFVQVAEPHTAADIYGQENGDEFDHDSKLLLDGYTSRQPGFIHISELSFQFLEHPSQIILMKGKYRARCIGHEILSGRPLFTLKQQQQQGIGSSSNNNNNNNNREDDTHS